MKFELTPEQAKKVRKWIKKQEKKNTYYGAIGGSVTYEFTPTSLGIVEKVKHFNGKVLDLTDYESW
jgi:hypothetical protein